MAEVLLFHHAQGQTPGFHAFADELRQAGHTVHTPDLFDGKGTATAELLGGGQEEAEADAVKVAQELKAFADISSFTVPYADALARRKVVNIVPAAAE